MSWEYPRTRRITHRSEFEKLLNKGTRIRTLDFDVRGLASPLGYIRVGLIIPKAGHTAVSRNKLKRRLRELTRLKLLPIPASCDVAIRCRSSAYERQFRRLDEQIEKLGSLLVGSFGARSEA